MKIEFYKNMGGRCENCGRSIKHVYVVEDDGFWFKCGSECIRSYLNITEAAKKYILKQIKEAQQYLDKKAKLEKLLEANDIDAIRDFIRDRRDEETVIREAYDWLMVYEGRAKRIMEKLNEKLNESGIRIRREVKEAKEKAGLAL
jgi:GTP cyclohydrolase FolE2